MASKSSKYKVRLVEIAVLFIVLIGLVLTVFLVQKQQNLRQEAARGSTSCKRCSDTYKHCSTAWTERDFTCDRNNVVGATYYALDCNCTMGTQDCSTKGIDTSKCKTPTPTKPKTPTPTKPKTPTPTNFTGTCPINTVKPHYECLNGMCVLVNSCGKNYCSSSAGCQLIGSPAVATPKPTTKTYTTCTRCSDAYKYARASWQEGDSVCDRNNIIGTTTYTKDCSCTQGVNTSMGYSCP